MGSPRTFSSREDSGKEEENRIVFADDGRKDESDSSDDEDDRLEDELITSFNKFGAQRVNGKKPKTKASTGPLVIPSKPNPDWQETARKRRTGAARFIPDLARANTGANGSIGALGTRDTINSGPQLSGIQFGNKKVKVDTSTTSTDGETNMTVEEHVKIDIVHKRDRRSKSPCETDARMMTVMLREKVIAIEPEMRRRDDSRRDCDAETGRANGEDG